MRTSLILILVIAASAAFSRAAEPDTKGFTEHMTALIERGGSPRKLKNGETATTKTKFKPPVEIIIEAKTDSTDLRISYAANKVCFNWDGTPTLRVEGGPADGQHKAGAGQIPKNKYVTIRWVVTEKKQTIYVDGQLRFEHTGNYAGLENPVSVFSYRSEVTVKTIKVKQLPPGTE